MKTDVRRQAQMLAAAPLVWLAACSGGGGGESGGGPGPAAGLAGITGSHMLASIGVNDAGVTLRSGPGPAGFSGARTMTMDSATDTLYVIDDGLLVAVAARGGAQGLDQAPRAIGRFHPSSPKEIAWSSSTNELFGVVHMGPVLFRTGKLVRIDPSTAETVDIGTCEPVDSLAFDVPSGMLYGVRGSSLFRIDPSTGGSTELFVEPTYLADCEGLTSDRVTGLLYAAHNPAGGTPGILSLSLSGLAQLVATNARPLQALEVDGDTGTLFGMTRGRAIVELGGAMSPAWRELGGLGARPIALSFDPADGGFFAVNLDTDLAKTLVKLRADGRIVSIGGLGEDVGSIAYDPVTRELWGSDFTNGVLVSIDPATGATSPVTGLTLSVGTRLAIDQVAGTLYGYDQNAMVTLLIDPQARTKSLLGNAIGVTNVGGLELDPSSNLLIAGWRASPGADTTDFSRWAPSASGVAQGFFSGSYDVWALGVDTQRGLFHIFDGNATGFDAGEMFTSDLASTSRAVSVDSLWNRPYRAAVRVPELGEGFAIDGDNVYRFDLASGETTRAGALPGGSATTGILWNADTGRLGYLMGSTIRWSSPSTPWNAPTQTALNGPALDVIARDPSSGLCYACDDTGLFSVAINGSTGIVIQLGTVPAGVDVTDLSWHAGGLFAASDDQRLYRIDPGTGAWTEVGRMAFQVNALY